MSAWCVDQKESTGAVKGRGAPGRGRGWGVVGETVFPQSSESFLAFFSVYSPPPILTKFRDITLAVSPSHSPPSLPLSFFPILNFLSSSQGVTYVT